MPMRANLPLRLGRCFLAPIIACLSSSVDKSGAGLPPHVRPSSSSLSASSNPNMLEESRQAFVDWAKDHAIPLEDGDQGLSALAGIIGDASVVAISEGFHNGREILSLHQRIVEYLIRNHGFTTVITESGLPESRRIHEYITGKYQDEKESVYTKGLNKMYSAWKEGRALIEFMRRYNQDNGNGLNYYGSDIGGFYQDWKTPFTAIFDYLAQVDPLFHEKLSEDLESFLDLMSQNARLNYQEKLSGLEKAKLEVILDEAVEVMDMKRETYIGEAKSSEEEYEWARQSLESMRLAEHYYRNYEQRCRPDTSKYVGLNGREVAMHRNTLWALERERRRLGRDPKAIIISHVIHTKTESQYQDELWGYFTPAGQMLKQSLGGKFCVIGMVCGGGYYWKGWQKGPDVRQVAPIPEPHQDGLESILGAVSERSYLIPWKEAPDQFWLSSLCSMRENDYFINIRPREWDACIFLKQVQPATPAE